MRKYIATKKCVTQRTTPKVVSGCRATSWCSLCPASRYRASSAALTRNVTGPCHPHAKCYPAPKHGVAPCCGAGLLLLPFPQLLAVIVTGEEEVVARLHGQRHERERAQALVSTPVASSGIILDFSNEEIVLELGEGSTIAMEVVDASTPDPEHWGKIVRSFWPCTCDPSVLINHHLVPLQLTSLGAQAIELLHDVCDQPSLMFDGDWADCATPGVVVSGTLATDGRHGRRAA